MPSDDLLGVHDVEYVLCDLMTNAVLARLPFTQVTFSYTLNAAGQFSGTLPIEGLDPVATNWEEATRPAKTILWVVADGATVWGGIVWSRNYSMVEQTIRIQANDFWSYFNQRQQAKDYSYTWVSYVDPMMIAETVVNDALAVANSGLADILTVEKQGSTSTTDWVIMSYPYQEMQSVEMIVTQLQQMGYGVGFDFAIDVADHNGTRAAFLTLSYPRRGRVAGTTGLALDITTATDFTFPEDGTKTGNRIYEVSTSAGSIMVIVNAEAAFADNYPLLEQLLQHPDINSTPLVQPVLQACANSDLALYAYPVVTPTVTIPLWGTPSFGEYIVGDDIRLIVPKVAGAGMKQNPRFPNGMDAYWRIVQVDVTIADEGLSTAKLTLDIPPSASGPVAPPTS